MASSDAKSKGSKGKSLTNEQIVQGFNELRQQQRGVVSKVSELEMEKKEHELVADTLKDVDGDRKCYRMVGGVLVERTVKDVLPALQHNVEQMKKLLETLHHQLEVKGKELQEYKEKYNIRIQGESSSSAEEDRSAGQGAAGSAGASASSKPSAPGVLVARGS